MTGSSSFGPYELRGLLGRGGMGEVHLAHDERHERVVALKLLPEGLAGDPAFTERFAQECQAVAQLTDPHVIPVHRFGEVDGRPFIDMRLVDGPDLARLLDREGPLPAARAVALVEQAALALDAAHAAGVLHRDVKPSNLLVAPHDFVYLVDFGLAEAIGASSAGEDTTVGTPHYLAPERVLTGQDADERADVYSLACVLFECLTGRPPFALETTDQVVRAHLTERPPRVTELRPELPPELDTVLARGMAKVPDARYATAGALAAAARAALDGEAVAPPAVAPEDDVGLDVLLGAGRPGLGGGVLTRPVRRSGVRGRGARTLLTIGAGVFLVLGGAVLGSTAFRPDTPVAEVDDAKPAPATTTTSAAAPSSSAVAALPTVTPSPIAVSAPVTEVVRVAPAPQTSRAPAPAPRRTAPRTSAPPPPPPPPPSSSTPAPEPVAPTTVAPVEPTVEVPPVVVPTPTIPPPTTSAEPAPTTTAGPPTWTRPTYSRPLPGPPDPPRR